MLVAWTGQFVFRYLRSTSTAFVRLRSPGLFFPSSSSLSLSPLVSPSIPKARHASCSFHKGQPSPFLPNMAVALPFVW